MPDQDMLINAANAEECRIAIVEDGKLEELYSERASDDLHVSNIYRGRVTNVEPAIQAAFVDFGQDRSGFLHISDLHPRYFPGAEDDAAERVGYKTPRRDRPPIQQCLRRGQTLLVQVLKEGIGTKGPTVTSYLSIPGRFLVMMPYMERQGVSRKIEDPEKRAAVRKILDELDPPEGFGFIVRTAGLDQTKTELKRDLAYLLRLWRDMEKKVVKGRGAVELYTESDLIIRTLRDVMTKDVKRVIVDDRTAAMRAKDFLRLSMPRGGAQVLYYDDAVPMFDAFDIERQIQSISERKVAMASGGSLVFDQTEALVAIDVNSGKSRSSGDAETNAYKTNCEAVDEIARQLRLRDLGGLIVLDLIDMYKIKHRAAIEKRFRDLLKKDRARTKTTRISELGMMEMTRQRMRPSLKKATYTECTTCNGAGLVLNPESVVLRVMRQLAVVLSHDKVERAEVALHPQVATMLLNRRRAALVRLEEQTGKTSRFIVDLQLKPDAIELAAFDTKNNRVDIEKLTRPKPPTFRPEDEITAADAEELEDLLLEEQAEAEGEATGESAAGATEATGGGEGEPGAETGEGGEGSEGQGRKKRRRRRRRRRGGGGEGGASEDEGGARHDHQDHDHVEHKGRDQGDRDDASHDARVSRSGYTGSDDDGDEHTSPVDADAEPGDDHTGQATSADGEGEGEQPRKRRRRRGGRRRRKRGGGEGGQPTGDEPHAEHDADREPAHDEHRESTGNGDAHDAPAHEAGQGASDADGQPKKKRRRRRRRRGGAGTGAGGESTGDGESTDEPAPAEADAE